MYLQVEIKIKSIASKTRSYVRNLLIIKQTGNYNLECTSPKVDQAEWALTGSFSSLILKSSNKSPQWVNLPQYTLGRTVKGCQGYNWRFSYTSSAQEVLGFLLPSFPPTLSCHSLSLELTSSVKVCLQARERKCWVTDPGDRFATYNDIQMWFSFWFAKGNAVFLPNSEECKKCKNFFLPWIFSNTFLVCLMQWFLCFLINFLPQPLHVPQLSSLKQYHAAPMNPPVVTESEWSIQRE